MQRNMKKNWLTTATFFTAFTAIVNADVDNAQMRNLENRVSALEQRRGASGMINPPARPQVKDGADLFVFGDLLVWQPRENGMAVCIINEGTNPSTNLSDADVRNMDFEWNVGFRVGVGYNLPHDGWDMSLTWLRFHGHGHRRVHADSDEVIYPRFTHPADPISDNLTCSKLHAHWKGFLNQLDFDFGREFFVSKWLTVRPHFGLRSDWIWQKLSVDNNRFASSGLDVDDRFKDHWWGIGLEGGLNTLWGLGSGWSIYGDVGAAIIYGFHHITQKEKIEGSSGKFENLENSYHISHPILDLALGLRWDHMFEHDRFHIGLHAGWEHHVYFSQNQFLYFTDDFNTGNFVTNQGDLTFQGWTVGARFDF